MEIKEKRHIKDGREFDHLFPKATGEVISIKKHAKLEDTIKFLPEAIEQTLYQTKLIAPRLIATSEFETCRKVWNFCFDHFQYEKDPEGKEAIRSPQNSWATRHDGIDCDDYTVLICSIMRNLQGKGFRFRITMRIAMYHERYGFQHIYPVITLLNGTEVIMDCVAKRFNYEVPFIQKIDKPMELQFLNGIPDNRKTMTSKSIDADDLLDGYDGDDIGDLGRRKSSGGRSGGKGKLKNFVKKVQSTKVAQTVRKGLHIANRLNPAAALLRTGILIALKSNLFKIAERLKFAYLTPQQVQQQDLDEKKHQRLIEIKNQLETIFFRAGGKTENFKKAILTGKGNRNKEVPVSGLGNIEYREYAPETLLSQVIGIETYNSELSEVQGFGSLGEPITAGAAVTAATGVLTAIAALLKSIGGLKKDKGGKNKEGADESATDRSTESDPSATDTSRTESSPASSTSFTENSSFDNSSKSNSGDGANKSNITETPASVTDKTDSDASQNTTANKEGTTASDTADSSATSATDTDGGGGGASAARGTSSSTPTTTTQTGFIAWVKQNPVPAAIGGVILIGGIAYAIYYFTKDKKENQPVPQQQQFAMSGVQKKKKNKNKIRIQKLR